jgi:hypothetical protein
MNLAHLFVAVAVGLLAGGCGRSQEVSGQARNAVAEPQATRVAVLNVGLVDAASKPRGTMSANLPVSAYVKAAEELKAIGADVVVLKINEGSACGTEGFIDAVERAFRPRFRTVGWVSEAINEGAIAAMAIPEVCMTPEGYWGAASCHAWNDKIWCDKLFARAAASGGRPVALVRSVSCCGPLSVSVVDGKCIVSADEKGTVVVPDGRQFALNAVSALQCGASIGTAETRAELAVVLGLKRVEWVGAEVDERVQARCAEAARAFCRVNELMNKAMLANAALAVRPADGPRIIERMKRDAAWAEVRRIRTAWPELADCWPVYFISAGWGGDPLATWEMVAKSVGVTE